MFSVQFMQSFVVQNFTNTSHGLPRRQLTTTLLTLKHFLFTKLIYTTNVNCRAIKTQYTIYGNLFIFKYPTTKTIKDFLTNNLTKSILHHFLQIIPNSVKITNNKLNTQKLFVYKNYIKIVTISFSKNYLSWYFYYTLNSLIRSSHNTQLMTKKANNLTYINPTFYTLTFLNMFYFKIRNL